MTKISGKWRFAEKLDFSIFGEENYEEKVNFLNIVWNSLYGYCGGLRINSSGLEYTDISEEPYAAIPSDVQVYSVEDGWLRAGHDLIDFQEEQEITEILYDWITTNAKPQIAINGCWKLREDIVFPDEPIYERINFISGIGGGLDINKILITNEIIYWWKITQDDFYAEHYEGYEILDFGNVQRYVSTDFYNFLQLNADLTDWEDHFETVSGLWKIKDEVEGVYCDFGTSRAIKIGNFDVFGFGYEPHWEEIQIACYRKNRDVNEAFPEVLFSECIYDEGWTKYESPNQSCQYWDFGETPHYITKSFGEWLRKNGVEITSSVGTVEVNGKVISQLSTNQLSKLHCKDKIMPYDIQVGSFTKKSLQTQPLITSIAGSFDKGIKYEQKSYWLGEQDWEASFSIGYYPIGLKKIGSLPDNNCERYLYTSPEISLFATVRGQKYEALYEAFSDTEELVEIFNKDDSGYWNELVYYCINAEKLNTYLQTNYFENNTVYLHNLLYIQTTGSREGTWDVEDIRINLSLPIGEKEVLFDRVEFISDKSGTLPIYSNGIVDVSLYNEVDVNVTSVQYDGEVIVKKWE